MCRNYKQIWNSVNAISTVSNFFKCFQRVYNIYSPNILFVLCFTSEIDCSCRQTHSSSGSDKRYVGFCSHSFEGLAILFWDWVIHKRRPFILVSTCFMLQSQHCCNLEAFFRKSSDCDFLTIAIRTALSVTEPESP